MRKHNLISLIYANLEKTSVAVEEAAQASAGRATPMHACRCDRWGHLCTAHSEHAYTSPSSSVLLATKSQ
jgi:RES domain-containing protein